MVVPGYDEGVEQLSSWEKMGRKVKGRKQMGERAKIVGNGEKRDEKETKTDRMAVASQAPPLLGRSDSELERQRIRRLGKQEGGTPQAPAYPPKLFPPEIMRTVRNVRGVDTSRKERKTTVGTCSRQSTASYPGIQGTTPNTVCFEMKRIAGQHELISRVNKQIADPKR